MPNGKGSLECCCCIHYEGQWVGYDAYLEQGRCNYHKATLPSTTQTHGNRICSDFSPNEHYYAHNPLFEIRGVIKRITAEERLSWFGKILEPGMLYVFHYNDPPSVREFLKIGG